MTQKRIALTKASRSSNDRNPASFRVYFLPLATVEQLYANNDSMARLKSLTEQTFRSKFDSFHIVAGVLIQTTSRSLD